jgi:hypothetical protein
MALLRREKKLLLLAEMPGTKTLIPVLFFNFHMLHQKWQPATRGLNQIWLYLEVENLGILSHVAEQWNLLAKYSNFKRRKLEICPNPQKTLVISITYFLEM